MSSKDHLFLLFVRLGMGWMFLYAGVSKLANPGWSAESYLINAHTFSPLYTWLASPVNIGWVDFVNEWGLVLIGAALIAGIGVRYASWAGILMMLLYYFPVLEFPYVGGTGFIVNEHVIYILVLLLFVGVRAGELWGIDRYLKRHHISLFRSRR